MLTKQQKLRTLIELADAWDNESIDASTPRKNTLRECADAVRMIIMMTETPDVTLNPERSPTHRCSVCCAFWIEWSDGWSLCSKECGPCCDNAPMGDRIKPLIISDLYSRKEPQHD